MIDPSNYKEILLNAFKVGYRHIDTASFYETEELLGQAIKYAIEEGIVNRN